jgi:hypothetical protein
MIARTITVTGEDHGQQEGEVGKWLDVVAT